MARVLALILPLAAAQDPPAPAPAPSPSPAPSTPTVDPNVALVALRQQAGATVTAAGGTFDIGAWMYCDYREDPKVTTAGACYQECVSDTACERWNYDLQKGQCSLKSCQAGSGYKESVGTWITGSVATGRRLSRDL